MQKKIIFNLISDPSYSSEIHSRSERIEALKQCNSMKSFEKLAKQEYCIICKRMEPFIGKATFPFIPYTEHININILSEKREAGPTDICDFGGMSVTYKNKVFRR